MIIPAVARKKHDLRRRRIGARLRALALLSLVIAAKAYTPEYAFHAYLFAAAAWRRCSRSSTATSTGRPSRRRSTIDGKPNYNMGPVKFATVAAVFWGIAGFPVGCVLALRARLSGAQLRSAVDHASAACGRCTPPR